MLALYTWDFSISTHMIVKLYLVAYLSDLHWNEISHNVTHAISGTAVCSKNCLFATVWMRWFVYHDFYWFSNFQVWSGPVEM